MTDGETRESTLGSVAGGLGAITVWAGPGQGRAQQKGRPAHTSQLLARAVTKLGLQATDWKEGLIDESGGTRWKIIIVGEYSMEYPT